MPIAYFSEGTFELVPGLVDRSVQVYLDGPDENKTGLVIVREAFSAPSLAAHVAQIVDAASRQIRRYECLSDEEGEVGGLPAVLLKSKMLHEGRPVFQVQALVRHEEQLVTFTVTSPFGRRERAEEIMDSLLASLRFRGPSAEGGEP